MDILSNGTGHANSNGKILGGAPPLFNFPQDYLRYLFFRVSRDLLFLPGYAAQCLPGAFPGSRCWALVWPCLLEASAQPGGII